MHRSGSKYHRLWDPCVPNAVPRGARPGSHASASFSACRPSGGRADGEPSSGLLARFSPLLESWVRKRRGRSRFKGRPIVQVPWLLLAFRAMRAVVVMFCDLVDSTGIAAKLDAHRIPRANCCATAPSVVHEATFTPALAASPYRHRNHPGRPRVGHLHGSPSARGDEMVSARWTPSASMVRCWCPRLTPALNKATMGIGGQSGWQSQRWKRHGAPSSNASARHKSATRSIGSDIRAAYNGCARLAD